MTALESTFSAWTTDLKIEALDPSALGPAHILRLAKGWELKITLTVGGPGAAARTALNPAMRWHVLAYLESIGPQATEMLALDQNVPLLPDDDLNVPPDPDKLTYTRTFAAPQLGTPTATGVYKLVTVLTSEIPQAGGTVAPGPFAGFEEGPMLQFY